MSLFPTRKLVEAAVTASAVNAQIAALNTLYGLTGANAVPNVVLVADGAVQEPSQLTTFPALLLYVGTTPAPGETVRFQKRDIPGLPVALAYHTKSPSKALARVHVEVTLEALLPLLETLQGQQYGSTGRHIVTVDDPALSFTEFHLEGVGVRYGGTLTCTVWARTQGA